jgi:hypothetical protein
LSFITGPHERVMPLLDGRVKIEGVENLVYTISDPSVTFWRQLSNQRRLGRTKARY